MGNDSGKLAQKLSEQVDELRTRIELIIEQCRDQALSADEAYAALKGVKDEIGKLDLDRKIRDDILRKLLQADDKIYDLDELQQGEREQAAREKLTQDAESQLLLGKQTGNLMLIYSQEYGDGYGKNYVQQLLDAGRQAGGYRYPREGQKLKPISDDVHELACRKASGVSSSKSTSNGLINRIREQSAIVVDYAYKAGYIVENDGVQEAMGNLARAVAFTLDSDSGARDIAKEHNPRGMSYNLDTRVPGVQNSSQYTGAPSEDPLVLLDSHERSLVNLKLQLSFATESQRQERLRREIERLEKEVEDLKRKLAMK